MVARIHMKATTALPQGDRWHLPALPTTLSLDRLETTLARLLLRSHPICKECARLVLRTQARRKEKGPIPSCSPPAPLQSAYTPTPGRPQGSHPLILTAPALTKTPKKTLAVRFLCKGGGRVVRSGDPCGRPGVGRFPSLCTLTSCLCGLCDRPPSP
jgi:hypothetical protein